MGNSKKVLRAVKHYLERAYVSIYSLSHPIKKQVLFESFSGKQYSDNPRAISEKLHELYPEYTIYWKLNSSGDKYGIIPSYVKRIPREKTRIFPLEYLKILATSCCLVTNEALDVGLPKRKGQFFICTWHGDRGFKKVAYDLPDFQGELGEQKLADLCLAGSDFAFREFRSAFRYGGEILQVGTPRDDCLLSCDNNRKQEVINRLGLDSSVRYLLYAPTFVDYKNHESQIVNGLSVERLIKLLEEKTNERWGFLSRSHSSSYKGLKFNTPSARTVIDVSDYPDMADILLICDFLITDYSSSTGDAALLGIPIILYIPQPTDRPLYFDLNKSPYYVANSQEELEHLICQLDEVSVAKNDKDILGFYGTYESGKASEKVANIIDEMYKNYLK